MATKIQLRRDTAANWQSANPILMEGELGIVTDDPKQYKVGDGVTAWNSLPLRGFDGTLVHEFGDSENAAVSQKVITEKVRNSAFLNDALFIVDKFLDSGFSVSEAYEGSDGIQVVDVTFPKIENGSIIDPSTGAYTYTTVKSDKTYKVTCPASFGVIALSSENGSFSINKDTLIAYSLAGGDVNSQNYGLRAIQQKYIDRSIIPIIYIRDGKIIYNRLTRYEYPYKLSELSQMSKILTVLFSTVKGLYNIEDRTITIEQGAVCYAETNKYDNISRTVLTVPENIANEDFVYVGIIKDTPDSVGKYAVLTVQGDSFNFDDGYLYAVLFRINPYGYIEYLDAETLSNRIYHLGDSLEIVNTKIAVTVQENFSQEIAVKSKEVQIGDIVEVIVTSDETADISRLAVSFTNGAYPIYNAPVASGRIYKVYSIVSSFSGTLYIWNNGIVNASGNIDVAVKVLPKAIKNGFSSIYGPGLFPLANEDGNVDDFTITFTEVDNDTEECTVTLQHPIILTATAGNSSNYIPSKQEVFEKAPYVFGCILAIFNKITGAYLRMEVSRLGGINTNNHIPTYATSDSEVAYTVVAWVRGNVVYSYQDVQRLKNTISRNKPSTFILPPAIYTVCNDLNYNRNYSLRLYIDHLLAFLDSRPDVKFNNGSNCKVFYSKYNEYLSYVNSNTPSTSEDVNVSTITDKLTSGEEISIVHRSVRNKATASKVVRLLCIGDSVTQGTGAGADKNKPYPDSPEAYWAWTKALFEMDRIEGETGYFFESLGNVIDTEHKGVTFNITDLDGINENGVKAYACGVGGTTTTMWLSSEKLFSDRPNVFYNPATQKFSLKYWVENYRTLIVNGDGTTTRCGLGNKGALAPEDTTQYNVCEPTHVLIQLGYNQRYSADGQTRQTYLSELRELINIIHSEYPDIYILLSLPDTSGTYYPELFPEYSGEGNEIYYLDFTKDQAKSCHDCFAFMNKDIITLCNENNKVFYCPTFFASPLCYGSTLRNIKEVAYLASNNHGNEAYIAEGALPNLHPSCVAHANWAYQVYGVIKYTLLL